MTTELECKKIFMFRCLRAVLLNVILQFLLLAVFLLFINISLLHPITWISETIFLVFSLYSWLCIMPLICITVMYGLILGKSYLSVKKYYSTRFLWIYRTGLRKATFFFLCVSIGFLTAWLYSRFLNDDYKLILVECDEKYCLNLRFMFLALTGIYTGIRFFIEERLTNEPEIEFPIIYERIYIRIRSNFYGTLYTCLMKSFVPTIYFMIIFWLFGVMISEKFGYIFNIEVNDDLKSLYAIMTSIRLIIYSWMLSSQIMCNMYLTDKFFNILITQTIEFDIEKNKMIQDSSSNITLVEALSLHKLPVAVHLASLDLYNIAVMNSTNRREKIFNLSMPGGHPYNWNQLCQQCLILINCFCDEISDAMKKLSPVKNITEFPIRHKPTATNVAEQILLRQRNESFKIRTMLNNSMNTISPTESNENSESIVEKQFNIINDTFDQIHETIVDTFYTTFRTIPGLFYLFGEQIDAKLIHTLSQSKHLIWITQALAAICERSLDEDKYGVIQTELPQIIKSLLNLKIILDRLNTLNYYGKKNDKNFLSLKSAVKRSLYRICTVFADYIQDIIDNPNDLRLIMCFVNYQEVW